MDGNTFKKELLPLHKRLYALALKLLGNSDDAQDAVQVLYLKLWERRGELKGIIDKWAFSSTVLTNICHDRWRSISRYSDESEMCDVTDIWNKEYEIIDFENFAHHYISNLPDIQKRVMLMRMEGATTEDIMAITGLSASNIRTILSRVRQLLRKHYNK